LSTNSLQSISPNIKKLHKLKNLYLLDNYLTDLPVEITELVNLEFANVLYKNDLSKIDLKIQKFLTDLIAR